MSDRQPPATTSSSSSSPPPVIPTSSSNKNLEDESSNPAQQQNTNNNNNNNNMSASASSPSTVDKKNEDAPSPASSAAATATSSSSAQQSADGSSTSSASSSSLLSSWSVLPIISGLNLLIVGLASVFATMLVISQVRTHPEQFTQNVDLSAGQVMAFLTAFAVLAAFAGVHFNALREYYASSSSASAKTQLLSADESKEYYASSSSFLSTYQLCLRRVASDDQYNALHYAAEFVTCLLVFFLCDRTRILDRNGKKYNRDTFWFLCLVFLLMGLGTLKKALRPKEKKSVTNNTTSSAAAAGDEKSQQQQQQKSSDGSVVVVVAEQQQQLHGSSNATRDGASAKGATTTSAPAPAAASSSSVSVADNTAVATDSSNSNNGSSAADSPYYHVAHLQRDQTEEWKGWMQVMFLWYHYFEAKEIYNVIRLYIAAYVWMTGFGNFSYYYIRKDFSLLRFCHMQWRLNFLVFWVCLMLQNEYMLYYICMLHTTFTVIIYAGLGIKSGMNQSFAGCVAKFVLLSLAALFVWDVPGVFDYAWWIFTPIVQFTNPYKPTQPAMYEWQFRSHLDHLVWIFGMLCAYNHPTWDGWLRKLDQMPATTGALIKAGVVAICAWLGHLYYVHVFSLPKKEYNALHPYTSFIPIALFIVVRNISQVARQYHIHLFEWLGKITLETYISQYHVWMATTGVNGSPKKLLAFLPKEYPLLNFAVASALCLTISFRLFHATNGLKTYLIPSSLSPDALKKTLAGMAGVLAALYAVSWVLMNVTKGSQQGSSTS